MKLPKRCLDPVPHDHDTNVYHPVNPTTHPYLSKALQEAAAAAEAAKEAKEACDD